MAKASARRVVRRKPGATGKGDFFHIQVRPRTEFATFRNQDVGTRGGIERVAGRRANGSWDTQKWLIAKTLAHVEGDKLIGDTADARKVLASLGSKPQHLGGDRFKAAPRRDIPESEKPTAAQLRAWARNIKKAQAARHGG
jgi:hypothetical protein